MLHLKVLRPLNAANVFSASGSSVNTSLQPSVDLPMAQDRLVASASQKLRSEKIEYDRDRSIDEEKFPLAKQVSVSGSRFDNS
jgi:hypothetical protein